MAIKTKTRAERHHLAKVAALGCIACTKLGYEDTPAEIHHIRDGMGLGVRSTHYETIPLCPFIIGQVGMGTPSTLAVKSGKGDSVKRLTYWSKFRNTSVFVKR